MLGGVPKGWGAWVRARSWSLAERAWCAGWSTETQPALVPIIAALCRQRGLSSTRSPLADSGSLNGLQKGDGSHM